MEESLVYFNMTAMLEQLTKDCNYGGLPYENVAVREEEFAVLSIEAEDFYKNHGICSLSNLTPFGNNAEEKLKIHAVILTINEIIQGILDIYKDVDEVQKAIRMDFFLNQHIPCCFTRFDEIAGENNGYLLFGKLSWADILFFYSLETMNTFGNKELIADYPNLVQLNENVLKHYGFPKWQKCLKCNAL